MTATVLNKKSLININLTTLFIEAMEEVKKGWEIDEDQPAGLYGWMYEVWLKRDAEVVDKPTRADILANARSAKKTKVTAVEPIPVAEVVSETVLEAPVPVVEDAVEQPTEQSE